MQGKEGLPPSHNNAANARRWEVAYIGRIAGRLLPQGTSSLTTVPLQRRRHVLCRLGREVQAGFRTFGKIGGRLHPCSACRPRRLVEYRIGLSLRPGMRGGKAVFFRKEPAAGSPYIQFCFNSARKKTGRPSGSTIPRSKSTQIRKTDRALRMVALSKASRHGSAPIHSRVAQGCGNENAVISWHAVVFMPERVSAEAQCRVGRVRRWVGLSSAIAAFLLSSSP